MNPPRSVALSPGTCAQFRLPGMPEPHPQYPPQHGPSNHPPPTVGSDRVRSPPTITAGEPIPIQHIPPPPLPFTRAQIHPPSICQSPSVNHHQHSVDFSPPTGGRLKISTREERLQSPPFSGSPPFLPESGYRHVLPRSRNPDFVPTSSSKSNVQPSSPIQKPRHPYSEPRTTLPNRSYSDTIRGYRRHPSQMEKPLKMGPPMTQSSVELSRSGYVRRPEARNEGKDSWNESPRSLADRQQQASKPSSIERDPSRGRTRHYRDQISSRQRSPWSEFSKSYDCPPHGFSYVREEKADNPRDRRHDSSVDSRLRDKWQHVRATRKVEFTPSTKSDSTDELPQRPKTQCNLAGNIDSVRGRRSNPGPNSRIGERTPDRKVLPDQHRSEQVLPKHTSPWSDFQPYRGRAPTPPTGSARLSPNLPTTNATKSSAKASPAPTNYQLQNPVEPRARKPSDVHTTAATAGSLSSRTERETERSPVEQNKSRKPPRAISPTVTAEGTSSKRAFPTQSAKARENRYQSPSRTPLERFRGRQRVSFSDEDSNLSVKLNRADRHYRSTSGSNSSPKGSDQKPQSPSTPDRGQSSKQVDKSSSPVINHVPGRRKPSFRDDHAKIHEPSGSQTHDNPRHRHSEPLVKPAGDRYGRRASRRAYHPTVRFASPTAYTCASCKSAAHSRDMASPKDLLREEKEQRLARGNKPVLGNDGKALPCDKCGKPSGTAWYDRVRGRRLYCWECFESKVEWHRDYWGPRIEMDKDDKARSLEQVLKTND